MKQRGEERESRRNEGMKKEITIGRRKKVRRVRGREKEI
jgi:hypothetical protein